MSEVAYWKATMGLRVKRQRTFWISDLGAGLTLKQYHPFSSETIQQAWLSEKGEIEWRDLEVLEVEEEMK